MKFRALVAAASALVVVLAAAPAAGRAPNVRALDALPTDFYANQTWTGLVAKAHANVKLRYVATNFVIPHVSCTSSNSKASFWAGLDGFGNGTVEQVGISTNCFNQQPTYIAWWEMYPQGVHYQFYARPGDSIFASVYYNSSTNAYNLVLNDNTNGSSINTNQKCPSGSTCQNVDAEVILEADNGTNLSNFTPVSFTGSAVTTRNGTHGTFVSGYYWDLVRPLMTGPNGDLARVNGSGANFSFSYIRAR